MTWTIISRLFVTKNKVKLTFLNYSQYQTYPEYTACVKYRTLISIGFDEIVKQQIPHVSLSGLNRKYFIFWPRNIHTKVKLPKEKHCNL